MARPAWLLAVTLLVLLVKANQAFRWNVIPGQEQEHTTPGFESLNENGGDMHWAMDKEALDEELEAQEAFDPRINQKNRILHCPPGSAGNEETQHDELAHAYINFVTKTCIFGTLIALGLVANIYILAVLQYFQVSPLRAVMRAEIVAIIAYLIFLIPLYPVAYLHPYTGNFELYEVAKPYVTPFFQTCNEICELLMVWLFLWLNRVRFILVVLWDKPKAEKCTPKAVRDELRLMTALAVIVSLPKFFDSEMNVIADPCNPGEIIVINQPNGLGENVIYELAYNVLAMALLYYVIPYLMLATYAYRTHHSLRKSERPAGETKQDVMKDRVKTSDGITTELDKRVTLFYVLLIPGALHAIAKRALYTVPSVHQSYLDMVETLHVVAIAFALTYAALSPIVVYATIYDPFRAKAKEKYWDKITSAYDKFKRRRQLEKEYELVRARLEQEEKNPGTLTIKLDSTDGPNTTIEDTTRL